MKQYKLSELAELLGAELVGDGEVQVSSIATLAKASKAQISFLSNSKYRNQLADTSAGAVVVGESDAHVAPCSALVMKDPYVGFARIAQLLDTTPDAAQGIAQSAVIADDVVVAKGVSIGANAVIESGCILDPGVQIGPGCFIGRGCHIGAQTKIWANVSIYHGTRLGKNCLIQSGAIIGSDGFGYANDQGQWLKIPQLGNVILGDRVEIGASTTIDRGALDDTILANGVIIDNQCQIAHNVIIGENTAIAGCTVIAGSANIGRQCTIGGAVAINGHMDIADNVYITGFSMVTKAIKEPGVYSSGMPASTNKEWRKNMVALRNIHNLSQRVKVLEKTVAK